jgi:hypothetical protein
MARIRTIKPEFFTSEDVVELSPLARLLYVALWCEADREGRLVWKPKTFKLRYFPADEMNIDNLSTELLGRGLVVLYGEGLAYIPTFKDHQHVNPREAVSTLPEPSDASITRQDASGTSEERVGTRQRRDSDAQGGRERKGRSKDASERVNGTFHVPDWVPAGSWLSFEEMRKRLRKPMTDTARNLILAELEKLKADGHDPKLVLEASIRNSWQDVYPLKAQLKSNDGALETYT